MSPGGADTVEQREGFGEHVIGSVDDPRFFASPERFNAGIIWFTHGFVEYMLPNYLTDSQVPVEILIAMEIASEAPFCG